MQILFADEKDVLTIGDYVTIRFERIENHCVQVVIDAPKDLPIYWDFNFSGESPDGVIPFDEAFPKS